MDVIKLAKYFYGMTNIPIAVYQGEELKQEFCIREFHPNMAYSFARPILMDDMRMNMDVTISADFTVCGFVQDRKSGLLLVIGPVQEFPCMRKHAYRILDKLKQPHNRVEEVLRYFESIPAMPLTTFTKHVIFLNYVVNGEEPAADYMDDKLTALLGKEKDIREREQKILHNSRAWDRQLEACVEYGKTEELETLLSSMRMEGRMGIAANDSVRSIKNVCISAVAIVARAANRGGMDYEAALTLSDEYIQKLEQLQDYDAVTLLLVQAFFDYTQQVASIRGLNANSRLARRVAGYVQEHVYEQIRLDDLAQYIGNNVSYLSRMFKKDTGKTLNDYINEVKIEEAKRLLSATDRSIADIAMSLGYSTQPYFTTLFKKRTGMTPAEFRESAGIW